MPRSASGKIGICTAVDAATGFIFATAIENETSQSVVSILCDLIIPYFYLVRVTVIAATVRIALVDILDLSEVDIPAGVFLHPAVGWG